MKKLFLLPIALLALSATGVVAQEELGFVGPGGCTTKEECRAYCDIDSNKDECLTFAVENGMMTEVEADRARKFLSQTGPGGCQGDECKNYCEDPAHTEECLSFAVEKGMINDEQAARMRKMREVAERGGPGGCKGEECRTYCEDESRRDECFVFARENGLIGEKEIEGYETGKKIRAKLETEGGPGGCKSEKECHSYCSDASRVEECVTFGARSTGKSPEEIRRMLEEFKNSRERFESGEFRGMPENFKQDRENFEQRRQEFEDRARRMREEFEERAEDRNTEFKQRRQEYEQRFQKEFPGQDQFPGQQNFPGQSEFQPSEGQYQQYQDMKPPEGYEMQIPRKDYQMMPPGDYQMMQPSGDMMAPPAPAPESAPTSYDHSRSFLANVLSAFLAPFKK